MGGRENTRIPRYGGRYRFEVEGESALALEITDGPVGARGARELA